MDSSRKDGVTYLDYADDKGGRRIWKSRDVYNITASYFYIKLTDFGSCLTLHSIKIYHFGKEVPV